MCVIMSTLRIDCNMIDFAYYKKSCVTNVHMSIYSFINSVCTCSDFIFWTLIRCHWSMSSQLNPFWVSFLWCRLAIQAPFRLSQQRRARTKSMP